MKNYDDFHWPTWEELAAEKAERWKNLPKKMKVEAVNNWREFVGGVFLEDNRVLRKKFKLSMYGKN